MSKTFSNVETLSYVTKVCPVCGVHYALALELEQQLREAAEKKLKRVDKGVCPKCNRSFCNLARHMASKHKEKEAA